jgi:hypothetical protein
VGSAGVPNKDGRYTEFGIVSFGHIFDCEFVYPVTFTSHHLHGFDRKEHRIYDCLIYII